MCSKARRKSERCWSISLTDNVGKPGGGGAIKVEEVKDVVAVVDPGPRAKRRTPGEVVWPGFAVRFLINAMI